MLFTATYKMSGPVRLWITGPHSTRDSHVAAYRWELMNCVPVHKRIYIQVYIDIDIIMLKQENQQRHAKKTNSYNNKQSSFYFLEHDHASLKAFNFKLSSIFSSCFSHSVLAEVLWATFLIDSGVFTFILPLLPYRCRAAAFLCHHYLPSSI